MKTCAPTTNGGLLRDTTHLAMGQGARLVIQAVYFVLIARALGPEAFGAFVTVVAMAALLGPFCGMGTQNLFIKNVRSGKRAAAVCWGNGILLTVLSGTLFSALAVGLSILLRFEMAASLVMVVALADLVFLKITELAAFGFTALNRMARTSIQNVAVSLLRLSAIVGAMMTFRNVTLGRWSVVYLAATVLGTIYAVWHGSQVWGGPHMNLRAMKEDAAEGLYFSFAGSAATVYNDIDKIMLSRLADLTSTGVYAAAYRVIDVSMTPIRALAAAAYPQFFTKGRGGIPATYVYAMFLVRRAATYGLFASAGLWILAPALPHLLGSRYQSAVPAVRWLALIPLLRSLHSFLADALSGAGLQKARTMIQGAVALVNIGFNLVILPIYSWRGAAWTSLGCDALLALTLWMAVTYYCTRKADLPPSLGPCGF